MQELKKLEEMKEKRERLAEAFAHTEIALGHDEYLKPFEFKKMDRMEKNMLEHPVLRAILVQCHEKDLGFDPNLLLQHIEKEALEQFNKLALLNITGQSIKNLMTMRHELELFLLKDRNDFYKKEVDKINEMIIEQSLLVSPVVDIQSKKKK